jgi:Pvc16 N-terminal domain
MSNSRAIAAVTATLRNLLTAGLAADPDLVDATVTTHPLDRVRVDGNGANQINIFLYHVLPSGAWRNMGIPGPVRSGEVTGPVLGLNLRYLVTVFGRDNEPNKPFSEQLMGCALSTLLDHPLLGAEEIKAALPNNDLWEQVERVRFTLHPFPIEEINKLWTGFPTQYRLSVVYEAAVVLIESTRRAPAPLPVLTRGQRDSGFFAQANLVPPFPTIDKVTLPDRQLTVGLGDLLVLEGQNLLGTKAVVQFANARLAKPITVPVEPGSTDTRISVKVPNDPATVPAGVHGITVVVSSENERDHSSGEIPIALAPRVTTDLLNLPIAIEPTRREAELTLTCSPTVTPDQHAVLVLGSRPIAAEPHPTRTDRLTFIVKDAMPGEFWVRLRIDGVDSQLIDPSLSPLQFNKTQKVTIR